MDGVSISCPHSEGHPASFSFPSHSWTPQEVKGSQHRTMVEKCQIQEAFWQPEGLGAPGTVTDNVQVDNSSTHNNSRCDGHFQNYCGLCSKGSLTPAGLVLVSWDKLRATFHQGLGPFGETRSKAVFPKKPLRKQRRWCKVVQLNLQFWEKFQELFCAMSATAVVCGRAGLSEPICQPLVTKVYLCPTVHVYGHVCIYACV